MAVSDDLAQVASDLSAAQAVVSQAVTDLGDTTTSSVGDAFLANAVSFLETQGYTVTAPGASTTASDSTDTSTSTDSSEPSA